MALAEKSELLRWTRDLLFTKHLAVNLDVTVIMGRQALLLLCLAWYIHCTQAPVQLIADLQAHFRAGCVFVLHNSKFS